jgi:ABC-type nitrate/sulfonate/bicarbonate transport system substrate-binding protein
VQGTDVVGTIGSTADYAAAVHEGRSVNSTATHRGRTVAISGRVPGNNWLERSLNRLGLTLRRNG